MDAAAKAPAAREMRQMQLQIPERVHRALREEAGRLGITPNILARLKLGEAFGEEGGGDRREIRVPVSNYGEIAGYVDEKQLGSVHTFAAFAMKQYMTRYPPKTAAKSPKGKSVGEGESGARAVQPDTAGGK